MAGRGREQTLPSWMVSGGGLGAAPAASLLPPGMIPAPALPSSIGPPPMQPMPYGIMHSGYHTDMPPNMPQLQPQLQPQVVLAPPIPLAPRPLLMTMNAAVSNNPISIAKPPSSQQQPPVVPIDPVNDVKCWSEHYSEDKRPFWYNKILKTSTYDKPQCLKTAIERSIPTCVWKEFTSSDGKKYYSDGTNSVWEMPAEFKLWKEKVEAAEKRKQDIADGIVSSSAELEVVKGGQEKDNRGSNRAPKGSVDSNHVGEKERDRSQADDVVYATHAEAVAAFKALLFEYDTSHSAKFKEVQDACGDDPRWNALKSAGEKKQALAEYQTQRVKLEKEESKARARKQRDAFFILLAETTAITSSMRFRECASIIGSDARFRAIEDSRLKEDYFLEFVDELEKKERQDLAVAKEERLKRFHELLNTLLREKKITHKSVWSSSKGDLQSFLSEDEKFRIVDETSMRRKFQALVDELEIEHREEGSQRRDAIMRESKALQAEFKKNCLDKLIMDGKISSEVKWKSVVAEYVSAWSSAEDGSFKRLLDCALRLEEGNDKNEDDIVLRSVLFRDFYDEIMDAMKDQLREDRRIIRSTMDSLKLKISYDTKLEYILEKLHEIADTNVDLKLLLADRHSNVISVFNEIQEPLLKEKKASDEKKKKREERFQTLLEEYYYRSDHVSMTWESAKKDLSRHSAYDDLDRSDRRRMFDAHIDTLKAKLAERQSAMLKVLRETSVPSGVSVKSFDEEEGEEGEEKEEAPRVATVALPPSFEKSSVSRTVVQTDVKYHSNDRHNTDRGDKHGRHHDKERREKKDKKDKKEAKDRKEARHNRDDEPARHDRHDSKDTKDRIDASEPRAAVGRGKELTLPAWMTAGDTIGVGTSDIKKRHWEDGLHVDDQHSDKIPKTD